MASGEGQKSSEGKNSGEGKKPNAKAKGGGEYLLLSAV